MGAETTGGQALTTGEAPPPTLVDRMVRAAYEDSAFGDSYEDDMKRALAVVRSEVEKLRVLPAQETSDLIYDRAICDVLVLLDGKVT